MDTKKKMSMTERTEVVGIRVPSSLKKRIEDLSKIDKGHLRRSLEYIVNTGELLTIPDDVYTVDKKFWHSQWEYMSRSSSIKLANHMMLVFKKNSSIQNFDDYISAAISWFVAHNMTVNTRKTNDTYNLLIVHNIHKNYSIHASEVFNLIAKRTNTKILEQKISNDFISIIFSV